MRVKNTLSARGSRQQPTMESIFIFLPLNHLMKVMVTLIQHRHFPNPNPRILVLIQPLHCWSSFSYPSLDVVVSKLFPVIHEVCDKGHFRGSRGFLQSTPAPWRHARAVRVQVVAVCRGTFVADLPYANAWTTLSLRSQDMRHTQMTFLQAKEIETKKCVRERQTEGLHDFKIIP